MNILLSFLNLLEMQCFLRVAVLPFFEPQMERFRLNLLMARTWSPGKRHFPVTMFYLRASIKSNLMDHLQRRFVAYVPKYRDSSCKNHFILYQFLRSLIIQILLPAKPALPVCRPR